MKKVAVLTMLVGLFSFSIAGEAVVKLEKVNKNELNVAIKASENVLGLQFDLVCDSKITEKEVNHAFSDSDPRSSMQVYSRLRTDGSIRVLMFDLTGKAITKAGQTERTTKIKIGDSGTCSLSNIVVAGESGASLQTTTDYQVVLPQESKVLGNYPNPFNPSTTIEFDLTDSNSGLVDIVVYDLQGRKVSTLYNGWLDAGFGHKFVWNASSVASGKYFAVISAPNGFSDTVNMTLIK